MPTTPRDRDGQALSQALKRVVRGRLCVMEENKNTVTEKDPGLIWVVIVFVTAFVLLCILKLIQKA